jgi:hypothetical protein
LIVLEQIDNKDEIERLPTEPDKIKANMDKIKEYYADYRVNDFNLLSNDERKIFELIKMNLDTMLKNQYAFLGVINTSKKTNRDFKMLFKKSINVGYIYEIYLHETILTQSELDKILTQNRDKVLKAVIVLPKTKENNVVGKQYFFIFEKHISKTKVVENDYLIIEFKKKHMPDAVFYEDLATKLNGMQKQALVIY